MDHELITALIGGAVAILPSILNIFIPTEKLGLIGRIIEALALAVGKAQTADRAAVKKTKIDPTTVGLLMLVLLTGCANFGKVFDNAVVAGRLRDHADVLDSMRWDKKLTERQLAFDDRVIAGGVAWAVIGENVPVQHCVLGFLSWEQALYLNSEKNIYLEAKRIGIEDPDVGWNNHGGFKRDLARGDAFWAGEGLGCSNMMKAIAGG